MIKALCYLRVSTEQQSVERQKEELLTFIQTKGFKPSEVVWHYKEGASAYKIDENYLELKEGMYKYLLDNPTCKTVFAWHINRLGRDEVQLQEIRKFMVDHKIQLFIKEPSLYLLNEDGSENGGMSLAFSLFATMSRLQIQELKAKTSTAKRLNAKKGKYNGGEVKLGYTVDANGYVVPNEGSKELELVLTAFLEYSTGKYSCKSLADELNARGFTFKGKEIERRMVNNILTDTAYIGYTDSDVARSHRTYIPVITDELFNKVGELLDNANKTQGMSTKHHYFASKMIECAGCGHNWTANHLNYRCSFHYNDKKKCGCADTIKISVMDGLLYEVASLVYTDRITQDSEEVKKQIQSTIEVNTAKIENFKKQLEGINDKKMKVQKGWENGIYDDDAYNKRIADIDKEGKGYSKKITQLVEENTHLTHQLDESYYSGDKMIENLESYYNLTDEEQIQKIIRTYIRKVKIGGTKTEKTITVVIDSGAEWNFCYYPFKKENKLYWVYPDRRYLFKISEIIRENGVMIKKMLPTKEFY